MGYTTGDFALGKDVRIHPTNTQVNAHNESISASIKEQGDVEMFTITAQDQIVDAMKNSDNIDIDKVIPKDIKTAVALSKKMTIFKGARVMLRCTI